MMNLKEFIEEAVKTIENDSTNVWVTINGVQYNVKHNITEKEPFEVSYTMEGDTNHPLWDDLYEEYEKEN